MCRLTLHSATLCNVQADIAQRNTVPQKGSTNPEQKEQEDKYISGFPKRRRRDHL